LIPGPQPEDWDHPRKVCKNPIRQKTWVCRAKKALKRWQTDKNEIWDFA
jgi:hypothetical protein